MNSPKQTTKRVLRLSIFAAAMAAGSLAQAQEASQMLNMAKQLKAIYSSQQAQSGATQAGQQMNQEGNGSADCTKLMQAKQNAASNYVKNKTPPDPTQVIKNSTCFVNVMEIQIPTTGIGFLDAVVGALGPFIKTEACNATSSWWNDMKTKVSGGQYGALIGQGFAVAQGGNVNYGAIGQSVGTMVGGSTGGAIGSGNTSTIGSMIGGQTGIGTSAGSSIGGAVAGGNTTTIGSTIGGVIGNNSGTAGGGSLGGQLGGIIGATVGNTPATSQPVVVTPANSNSSPANAYLQTITNLRGQLGL